MTTTTSVITWEQQQQQPTNQPTNQPHLSITQYLTSPLCHHSLPLCHHSLPLCHHSSPRCHHSPLPHHSATTHLYLTTLPSVITTRYHHNTTPHLPSPHLYIIQPLSPNVFISFLPNMRT
ncbi:hypothetical protein Pmani_003297 [Petrolisthes manimaculis]|uniref:Uncharacterized protein n=1 Tax=Petrolisthes manimaculis TaxID=1843537 RepID=A0AAE1UMM3_9EUCA|nr:hypothetical protein Pmani_003297 [Petrolisthes manimaculis]